MKDNVKRHHSRYVSVPNVIHMCMTTYLDMFSNMPPEWYVNSVYYSCSRKGYFPSRVEVAKYFMLYRPEWRGKVLLQDGSNFTLIE